MGVAPREAAANRRPMDDGVACLLRVPNDQPFWFAWAIFRPDTVVWEP